MTFSELVVATAQEAGLPKTKVARTLRSFIRVSREALASGSDVRLLGFGAFYTVVPKKKVLFGGTRKPRGSPTIRFKESRYGEVRRSD